MGEQQTRVLNVGDRLHAHPCSVRITKRSRWEAWAWCEPCQAQHVLDAELYEAGRGPWKPVAR